MKAMTVGKWLGLIGLLLGLLVAVPSVAALQSISQQEVIIGANEVIDDDLIVGADTFVLDGTVKGDLIVGGTNITINGTVEGDLMAGGQSVIINGRVLDDIRIAGAALTLGSGAKVGDDLIALGYSFEAQPESKVGGNLYFAGAQSRLAGSVAHDVWVEAGGLELLGSVGGNVEATVDTAEAAPAFPPFAFTPNAPAIPTFAWGLTVGPQAHILGDLNYHSPATMRVPVGTVIGNVTSEIVAATADTTTNTAPAVLSLAWFLDHLQRLIGLLVVGTLLVWLFPFCMETVNDELRQRPWASLGWGIVTIPAFALLIMVTLFVMIALAALLGMLTLGGLSATVVFIGLLLLFAVSLFFALAVAYFAKIVVSIVVGQWLLERVYPDGAQHRFWPLLTGLLLFVVLTAVPYIGGWVSFGVTLFGLGALWLGGMDYLRQRQVTPKAATPTGKAAIQPA
jgi:hypothetical protein